ncbi:MAG: hypothetical protein ACYTGH_22060 [Planctomycetota bacterium]
MDPQPLDRILTELGLTNHDLVDASTEQLTHKQVMKGRRGRPLTRNLQGKIERALNAASAGEQTYTVEELFTYRGR